MDMLWALIWGWLSPAQREIVLGLAAVITPPDIASQIIVTIPIIILYEVSIFISKIVYKKNQKELSKL